VGKKWYYMDKQGKNSVYDSVNLDKMGDARKLLGKLDDMGLRYVGILKCGNNEVIFKMMRNDGSKSLVVKK
jgi:hypothetical protein